MHLLVIWVVLCVVSDVVGTLFKMMTTCHNNYVVTVAHVMQPADDSIIEHGFMSHAVAVTEERISPLLVIGYHSLTYRLHQQVLVFAPGLSIHRLPQ